MTIMTKQNFLNLGPGEEPVLLLRTNEKDGTAYGGFRWPTEAGVGVEAPDWEAVPKCGNGLHGALWGCGESSHLGQRWGGLWYVVAANPRDLVDLDGKVKAPRVWIEYVGDRAGATQYIHARAPASATTIIGLCLAGGRGSKLTGGYNSTLTGGDGSTLTGGGRSTLTGGDGSTLTGGYNSKLTGGDYSTLTGGYNSKLTGGYNSTLTGGDYSTLTWKIWDWDSERLRFHVVYVGEGGIQDRPYVWRDGAVRPI